MYLNITMTLLFFLFLLFCVFDKVLLQISLYKTQTFRSRTPNYTFQLTFNLNDRTISCYIIYMQLLICLFEQHAWTDTTAATVLLFVLLIVRRADTRTDCVPVKQDGQDLTVQQVICVLKKEPYNHKELIINHKFIMLFF